MGMRGWELMDHDPKPPEHHEVDWAEARSLVYEFAICLVMIALCITGLVNIFRGYAMLSGLMAVVAIPGILWLDARTRERQERLRLRAGGRRW